MVLPHTAVYDRIIVAVVAILLVASSIVAPLYIGQVAVLFCVVLALAIGLVRQYFPKYRDLTTVTDGEVKQAMDNLNHRPRKSLGYQTPFEVFFKTRTSLTVALQSRIRAK